MISEISYTTTIRLLQNIVVYVTACLRVRREGRTMIHASIGTGSSSYRYFSGGPLTCFLAVSIPNYIQLKLFLIYNFSYTSLYLLPKMMYNLEWMEYLVHGSQQFRTILSYQHLTYIGENKMLLQTDRSASRVGPGHPGLNPRLTTRVLVLFFQ